jgi:hypothetical protein
MNDFREQADGKCLKTSRREDGMDVPEKEFSPTNYGLIINNWGCNL